MAWWRNIEMKMTQRRQGSEMARCVAANISWQMA